MRTLITGGTGLIGAAVADRLLRADDNVVVLDLEPDVDRVEGLLEEFGDRLKVVTADVRDRGSMRRALQEHPVDAIVHLASLLGSNCQSEPALATEVNILGSLVVFELARELRVGRVVCASSITLYGSDSQYSNEELPLHETATQAVAPGVRLYGAGKVYLEALAAAYKADDDPLIVGLRPSIVYGGTPKHASVDWLHAAVTAAAMGQKATILNGDAELSLVHLDDVVDQFVELLRAPKDAFEDLKFFNGGGDRCSIREFAEALGSVCPSAELVVEPGLPGPLMGIATSIDETEIAKLLGRPRRFSPLRAGLAQYVDAIRKDGVTSPES